MFEAPNKPSQFALLNHLGREVHLCNVRLEELLRVEIYRRGLHSDAFAKENLRPLAPNLARPRAESLGRKESVLAK
jgi:phosphosulfolactate synthase